MAGCTAHRPGQACQDVRGSWIRVAKARVQGGATYVAAAQRTSLLQLSHEGTAVRELVNSTVTEEARADEQVL